MIQFSHVTFVYPEAVTPTLAGVDLHIGEGELCVVSGPTGAGKSTLLGAINGLVPRASGGTLSGSVVVAGRDTRDHEPSEMAEIVGYVGQDPSMGFVAASVEEELAYGMEQRGIAPAAMRARVEETIDLLGIAHLRAARPSHLSGGEQQRVAVASVLTAHPHVLVLDEPTSALDPGAAEDVLSVLTRLVHDLGLTVVVAEHRLERVVAQADRVVSMPGDGTVVDGPPAQILAATPLVPPLIDLGRHAGWDPLPLTVRDARRRTAPILARIGSPEPSPDPALDARIVARELRVVYGSVVAVDSIDLDINGGEVTVVMGRNGAGKSSLLWAVEGSGPHTGRVSLQGSAGLVPQRPADLLYLATVAAECGQADLDAGAADGACLALLGDILPDIDPADHPSDLSEGQRLALVLAIQLVAEPDVVILDEPTRGLDYPAKGRICSFLRGLAAQGRAVVVATHDVEFAAVLADRVLVMAGGSVVTDGRARDVLTATPLLQSQVSKVLSPEPWLTVSEVVEAMAVSS